MKKMKYQKEQARMLRMAFLKIYQARMAEKAVFENLSGSVFQNSDLWLSTEPPCRKIGTGWLWGEGWRASKIPLPPYKGESLL